MRLPRLFGVLALAVTALAQPLEAGVDKLVSDAMRKGSIAGVSVAVFQHGRLLVDTIDNLRLELHLV